MQRSLIDTLQYERVGSSSVLRQLRQACLEDDTSLIEEYVPPPPRFMEPKPEPLPAPTLTDAAEPHPLAEILDSIDTWILYKSTFKSDTDPKTQQLVSKIEAALLMATNKSRR
jgi:hypothetical protein